MKINWKNNKKKEKKKRNLLYEVSRVEDVYQLWNEI